MQKPDANDDGMHKQQMKQNDREQDTGKKGVKKSEMILENDKCFLAKTAR